MNASTRVLGWKSREPTRVPTTTELRQRETELGLAGALDRLGQRRVHIPTLAELDAHESALRADGVVEAVARVRNRRAPDLNGALSNLRAETYERTRSLLGDTAKRRTPRDELHARARQATAEYELERALTFHPMSARG
jgi:hypothetical protein